MILCPKVSNDVMTLDYTGSHQHKLFFNLFEELSDLPNELSFD